MAEVVLQLINRKSIVGTNCINPPMGYYEAVVVEGVIANVYDGICLAMDTDNV